MYYKSMTVEEISQEPRYKVTGAFAGSAGVDSCFLLSAMLSSFLGANMQAVCSFLQPEDLISSIGGSLGLFTGVSLLTLLEFLKLLFDLMGYFCRKHSSTVNPPMSSNEVTNVNENEPEKKTAFS